MNIVLDTNVLISGIFFSGPPSLVLKAWRKRDIQFVISPEIAEEYFKVSGVLSQQYPGVDINSILTLIVNNSRIIQPAPLAVEVCEDPDDDKFLAYAVESGCEVIVSGDKHLLKLSPYQGISILTPRAFVEQHL